MSLRKPETEKKCQDYIKTLPDDHCYFCQYGEKDLVQEFTFWVLIVNHFPYDKIDDKSLLLAPKKHINSEEVLTMMEKMEYWVIENKLPPEYTSILKHRNHKQSFPNHLHYHVLNVDK